jgi:hypothetical protein
MDWRDTVRCSKGRGGFEAVYAGIKESSISISMLADCQRTDLGLTTMKGLSFHFDSMFPSPEHHCFLLAFSGRYGVHAGPGADLPELTASWTSRSPFCDTRWSQDPWQLNVRALFTWFRMPRVHGAKFEIVATGITDWSSGHWVLVFFSWLYTTNASLSCTTLEHCIST